MLSEIIQRKTNTVGSLLYVEYKNKQLIDTENRLVIPRHGGWGVMKIKFRVKNKNEGLVPPASKYISSKLSIVNPIWRFSQLKKTT